MNKRKLSEEYEKNLELYNRLGQNIVDALKTFLSENEISFLDIYYRIKTFNSFFEKIDRKNYTSPFEEIEDICGIRVICYYATDVEKINKLISDEFSVLEKENKSDLLTLKEFAYRSQHFIVKINKDWNAAPNYRKLEDLKVEIQVRTILMHAWAEIEHKLNYKNDAQVPEKFQRKLFRLSAKFEEADEQFDELRTGIEDYKDHLTKTISKSNKFNNKQEFNLETFKAFLKFHFPEDTWEDSRISIAFDDFTTNKKDFDILENAITVIRPHFKEIVNDLIENSFKDDYDSETLLWIAMDILDDETYKIRNKEGLVASWKTVVDKWREKLK